MLLPPGIPGRRHSRNGGNGRRTIFHKDADFAPLVNLLREAGERRPVRFLAPCTMPNHWHLVLWHERDGELSEFLRWLTVTLTQRYHAHYQTAGTGPLYRGHFRSFPAQDDDHLLTVLRYVERNPLRVWLAGRAGDWRWSSLWQRQKGQAAGLLDDEPVLLPAAWQEYVDGPQTEAELEALRRCVARGSPFGDPAWAERRAQSLELQATLRRQGRPRKATTPGVQ